MVALDDGNMAVCPTARQVEIVGTLATDVSLADMFLPEDGG